MAPKKILATIVLVGIIFLFFSTDLGLAALILNTYQYGTLGFTFPEPRFLPIIVFINLLIALGVGCVYILLQKKKKN